MAYGFAAYNDSGYLQVDENYSNYTMIASGSAGSTATVTPPAGYSHYLWMIQPNYGVYFWSNGFPQATSFSVKTADGSSYIYRIYAKTSEYGTSGSFGLRVFNSSGQCNFDSNQRQLTISTVVNAPAYPSTIAALSYKPYLWLNPISVARYAPETSNQGVVYAVQARINSDNSVSVQLALTGDTGPPILLSFLGARQIMEGK